MAEREIAINRQTAHGDRDAHQVVWTGLLFSGLDTGEPLAMPASADRSVQLVGDLGVGGSVRIEGSNDGGVTWGTLHDPTGGDLDLAAIGQLEAVTEATLLLRPRVTAGDGATDLDVYMTIRRKT